MHGERLRAALIEHYFPEIADWGYVVTSDITCSYNCIAWAAGDDARLWWPSPEEGSAYWPPGIPRADTVEAFAAAYGTLGYVACDNEEHEVGFEKIAIFATASGEPTHAARQLDAANWTSKLGSLQDIRHPLRALEGSRYGKVVLVMKRAVDLTRQEITGDVPR
ncbi:hypothetical protein WMF38_51300 [Sorangium sp. So ce118]